jgi:hypothetical protein
MGSGVFARPMEVRMVRKFSVLAVLMVFGTGCEEGITKDKGPLLPDIELSTHRVDFGEIVWGDSAWTEGTLTNHGEVPLGIASLSLVDGEIEENFQLQWSNIDVSCTEGAGEEDGDDGSNARSLPAEHDGDDESAGQSQGQITILQPGCKIDFRMGVEPTTVGPIHGSILIEMVDDEGDEPAYHSDPDHKREIIILEAVGTKGAGNIVISPRNMNFGHPWTSEPLQNYIRVHNVGNGVLVLGVPDLDPECSESIVVDLSGWGEGLTLEPYTSTLIPVVYTPVDTDEVTCKLVVPSDDIDMPSITVTMTGNEGDDPRCSPPSVQILSPEAGAIHQSTADLELELKISDSEQPATTLTCSVRSAILGEGDRIAYCTPIDESGYTFVQIPANELQTGRDTLTVTVKDECGFETIASVSVLVRTAHTENDNDGDGFDELDDIPDCDDTNANTYPFATEIYDELDNDCDGEIDEDTEGSDDDGDGQSEMEGDCNDYDATTYAGAPEQADWIDNDCDGQVDEGTTLVDDDGDGFAEVDNDCDDSNPDISPAAIEYCDGLDNNCNGLKDQRDGCISTSSEPEIIGGIQMDATAVAAGESIMMSVTVYDEDDDRLAYSWRQDDVLTESGHNALDSTSSQTVTWTAPLQLPNEEKSQTFSIQVVIVDEAGNQDYAVEEITVFAGQVPERLFDDKNALEDDGKSKGCGNKSEEDEVAESGMLPGVALLLLAGLYRRRRD